ncbi:DUF4440 domain-containing protein [Actinophytocola xanthii]|uniref:DUF4440 domain-containing protein n=1 Tax=Actinophytocola xanthii TaxID=1912961 RepID=A0A1Q8CLE9_9PSEU|nr:DUF4440 domain-containing protein [Actinophytocola xanthii]OLF15186.1 hypothetical protein BU204_23280 [Actinophytocola xanthii]
MRDEAGAIVEVGIRPGDAFEVFTRDTDKWWRSDRSITDHAGPLRFDGDRVLAGDGTEVGRVRVWEAGPRLVFSYGGGQAEVEVRFEEIPTGTRVVLRHYGWDASAPGPWASVLAGFARHSLERVLLARIGDFLDAIGNGDAAFFERNLTDDALLIFPGGTYTKQQCVAEMSDHPPYVKYDIEESWIVHLGESTAVISHRARIMHAGNAAERSIVVTSVLVREDDGWLMALNQWTAGDEN